MNRLSRDHFQLISVLCVDDEPYIREVLVDIFLQHGATARGAENGKAALEIFLNNKIDLVVSDIRMPGSDGLVLLDKIREHNKKTPFILVTGLADFTRADALARGASALILKPFEPRYLLDIASELLSINRPIGNSCSLL